MSKNKPPSIIRQIQNFNPPEVNYAYQKAISYSQLSTFVNCPHKWELNYKQGNFIPQVSIHMVFGTALHNTIQHYITTLYNDSGVKADELNLQEYFEDSFRETYSKEYKKNNNVHFSNPVEMREFFDDGINILNFIKNKRKSYFGKHGWWLVGVEVPIHIIPDKRYNNVLFKGYIDLVLYHEPTNKFVIYDFKTSTRGWVDKDKKDELKSSQLILYKEFFSQQFNVPKENIEVEFFILKRKLYENVDFPQKRIQQFIPPSGKNKTTKALDKMKVFIESSFNQDGTYKDQSHKANPSQWNCRFCPYNDNKMCKERIN